MAEFDRKVKGRITKSDFRQRSISPGKLTINNSSSPRSYVSNVPLLEAQELIFGRPTYDFKVEYARLESASNFAIRFHDEARLVELEKQIQSQRKYVQVCEAYPHLVSEAYTHVVAEVLFKRLPGIKRKIKGLEKKIRQALSE